MTSAALSRHQSVTVNKIEDTDLPLHAIAHVATYPVLQMLLYNQDNASGLLRDDSHPMMGGGGFTVNREYPQERSLPSPDCRLDKITPQLIACRTVHSCRCKSHSQV